jgi:hypothetical protein
MIDFVDEQGIDCDSVALYAVTHALPLQHQPVASRTAAKFRRCRAATAHTTRQLIAFDAGF